MKKIISIILSLLIPAAGAWAESASPVPTQQADADTAAMIYNLYEFDGETMDITAPYIISFDQLFELQMPAGWQNFVLTEAQAEKGMFACFGDGTHFLFVGREEETGTYADLGELALTLSLDENNVSFFETTFGETAFICYSDYKNSASACATIIPEKGIYTFYFYPMDGNMAFAQTVLGIMNSYRAVGTENGNE